MNREVGRVMTFLSGNLGASRFVATQFRAFLRQRRLMEACFRFDLRDQVRSGLVTVGRYGLGLGLLPDYCKIKRQ